LEQARADMPIDFKKLESILLLPLVQQGCSAEVLRHAVYRYARACAQLRNRRKALKKTGVSEKQIQAQIAAANRLNGFLAELQQNAALALANPMPPYVVFAWRAELKAIEEFLSSIQPPRFDAKDVALALTMHIKERVKNRRLTVSLNLKALHVLNEARAASGLSQNLTLEALSKQKARANHQRAERLLRSWESSPPFTTKK
jgi:hypothetical protein